MPLRSITTAAETRRRPSHRAACGRTGASVQLHQAEYQRGSSDAISHSLPLEKKIKIKNKNVVTGRGPARSRCKPTRGRHCSPLGSCGGRRGGRTPSCGASPPRAVSSFSLLVCFKFLRKGKFPPLYLFLRLCCCFYRRKYYLALESSLLSKQHPSLGLHQCKCILDKSW